MNSYWHRLALVGLLAAGCAACNSKKADEPAPTATPVASKAEIVEDRAWKSEKNATWDGHNYHISLTRTPARDLPTVTDELGQAFRDNRVELSITKDGQPFYQKTFTKDAFLDFFSDDDLAHSVLQGMAFDDVEPGEGLRFGAQVGTPGDDGLPLVVTVAANGSVSITRDNVLDTSRTPDIEE